MNRFDTRITGIVLAVALLAALPSSAQAAFLNNSTGLGSTPAVTFDEMVLPADTALIGPYTSQVSFDGTLYYDSNNGTYMGAFPNMSGHYAGNFSTTASAQEFTIRFTTTQASAAFALSAIQPTTSPDDLITFTALLNGTVVESMSATADDFSSTNYYGFTGISFNAILVNTGSALINGSEFGPRQVVIDNIQLEPASANPVPAPSGLVLMGSGLVGLLGFRVVRRKTLIAAAA